MHILLTEGNSKEETLKIIEVGKKVKEKFQTVELTYLGDKKNLDKTILNKEINIKHIEKDDKKSVKKVRNLIKLGMIDGVVTSENDSSFPILKTAKRKRTPYFIIKKKQNETKNKLEKRASGVYHYTDKEERVAIEVFNNIYKTKKIS